MNFNDKKWWENIPKNDEKKPIGFKKYFGAAVIAIIILLAAVTVFTSIYTVNDKQQGVVTTFGKVTSIVDPGMHIKAPFGIQEVQLVNVNVRQKIEIGYRSEPDGTNETYESESKMITGDYNIVNADFFVEYQISDPVKYLYNSKQPDLILKDLVQSQIRNVVSSYDVDMILTTGKNEIQAKIKEAVVAELADYDIGLAVTEIRIQDAEPPTAEVIEAFREVETAKQDKETAINVANAYQNSEIPKAEAESDKVLKEAEYYRQDRINEAKKQVAMFNAMYGEYALNPQITKKRMYFEAIEKVLPGVKIYIDASDGTTQKLLPLESFAGTGDNN